MFDMKKMAKAYDNFSDYYEFFFKDWEEHKNNHKKSCEKLFEKLEIGKNAKIYDITCGIGTQIIALFEAGYKNLYGSDISNKQIKRAEELLIKHNVYADIKVCDACVFDKNIKKESFDVVLSCSNSLPLLGDKQNISKSIKACYNALKNEGFIILNLRDYTDILKTKPKILEEASFYKNNVEHIWYETAIWDKTNAYFSDIYFAKVKNNIIEGRKFSFPKVYALQKKELIEMLRESGFENIIYMKDGFEKITRPIFIAQKRCD